MQDNHGRQLNSLKYGKQDTCNFLHIAYPVRLGFRYTQYAYLKYCNTNRIISLQDNDIPALESIWIPSETES